MRRRELARLAEWRGPNGEYADPAVVRDEEWRLRNNPRHRHAASYEEEEGRCVIEICACGASRTDYGYGDYGPWEYTD